MNLLATGEVQRATALYTRGSIALCGDRLKTDSAHPNFELFEDSTTQTILLKIINVDLEPMYSKKAIEGLDIYILKEHAQQLLKGLESIFTLITTTTILDRANRDPEDSRYTYDDSGLALRIDYVEGWIKASNVQAYFNNNNIVIFENRTSDTAEEPKLHIDIEHNKTRLHFGFRKTWDVINENKGEQSYYLITFPWTEYGHLLGSIRNVVAQLN